jgi:hypothetical protein
MSVGETLFEQVVEERTICEREEAHYQSLMAFYALADARFKARCRITDGAYFPDDGRVMVSWERYLEQEEA